MGAGKDDGMTERGNSGCLEILESCKKENSEGVYPYLPKGFSEDLNDTVYLISFSPSKAEG